MSKVVKIVGDKSSRIANYISKKLQHPYEFVNNVENEDNVILCLSEKRSIEWVLKNKSLKISLITQCSVKRNLDKVIKRNSFNFKNVCHMHILFNPEYQCEGNIIAFGDFNPKNFFNDTLKNLYYDTDLTPDLHDELICNNQAMFHKSVLDLGSKILNIHERYRTGSMHQFLQVFYRINSLGPHVISEIRDYYKGNEN